MYLNSNYLFIYLFYSVHLYELSVYKFISNKIQIIYLFQLMHLCVHNDNEFIEIKIKIIYFNGCIYVITMIYEFIKILI